MKYAYFTVGLPSFSPKEIIGLLKEKGYDGVEWRVKRDNGNDKAPSFWNGNRATLQEDWPPAKFREIAAMTRDAGLEVPNIGTYVKGRDIDRVEQLMEVAKLLNTPCLRVGVQDYDGTRDYNALFDEDLNHFSKVEALAKKFSLKALIEIHMGLIVPSASAAIRFVSHFSHKYIGIIHDAGNMVKEGYENYQMGLEMLGDYLAHVHIKSCAWEKQDASGPGRFAWKAQWAPLREGAVDFEALYAALETGGYNGYLSIEDFSIKETEAQKLDDNIRFLKETEELSQSK
jgi:sugar phosphate isomerase/epimerase